MNFKSTNFKTALLGVVLVWTFFVPVFVSAKVLSPSMQGRSFNPNLDSANLNNGSRGETPILIPDQSSEVLKAHSVTPEMLHQMQELQNEGGQQEGNSNSNEQFSWQSGLLTGFVSSIFHKVSTFAKNNFRKIILPIASAVGATYALMSTYGTGLFRKVKTVASKVVRGLEQLGNETIKLAKPVVKFTKDVVGPIKEFASTYGAEAGAMGAIGAGLFAFATLKPIRQWGVKQISKGLKKLDSYAESFDNGSRTSVGMYGKGLAVGAGLTVVGLVSGLAMVAIEPELVQDAAGHAIVSTYNIATHPSKLVADVKQAKNRFLNWSDNTSMYEKGIAVSKFSINSALALDGAQAVITKVAALKTGTIAEEAATHVPAATTQPPDFLSGVKVISKGKEISSGTLDVNKTLQNFEKGIYKERIDSIYRNDMGSLPLHEDSYYTEYYKPTAGWTKASAGPERIVSGLNGEVYYTPDHYITFYKLK